jgi:hypothetical protein
MTSNSSVTGNTESESKIIDHMRAQFGRNLSPSEALELHDRSLKIPKC